MADYSNQQLLAMGFKSTQGKSGQPYREAVRYNQQLAANLGINAPEGVSHRPGRTITGPGQTLPVEYTKPELQKKPDTPSVTFVSETIKPGTSEEQAKTPVKLSQALATKAQRAGIPVSQEGYTTPSLARTGMILQQAKPGLDYYNMQRSVEVVEQPRSVYGAAQNKIPLYEKMQQDTLRARYTNQNYKASFYEAGSFALGFGAGLKEIFYDPIRHPLQTAKGVYVFGKELIKNPIQTKDVIMEDIAESATKYPAYTAGKIVSYAAGPKITEVGLAKGAGVYRTIGATEIPVTQLIEPKVLRGQKTFSTAESTTEAIKMFEKGRTPEGKISVYHAANPEKFPLYSETTTPSKPSAGKKLESAGLYVAPEGYASKYFLRLEKSDILEKIPKFSFLPKVERPGLVKIEVESIKTVPSYIRNLDDSYLKRSNVYLTKEADPKAAYITPRFQAGGTGEVEAVLTNVDIKPKDFGNVVQNVKGYRSYTIVEGNVVPIREFDIIGKGPVKDVEFSKYAFDSESYLGKIKKYSSYGDNEPRVQLRYPSGYSQYSKSKLSKYIGSSVLKESKLSSLSNVSYAKGSSDISKGVSRSSLSKVLSFARPSSREILGRSNYLSNLDYGISYTNRVPEPRNYVSVISKKVSSSYKLKPVEDVKEGVKLLSRKRPKAYYEYKPSVIGILTGATSKVAPRGSFAGVEIRPVVMRR